MAQNLSSSHGSPTAWETHYSNILSSLDAIAKQIVEKTDESDFWKEDLDLRPIFQNKDIPWQTFHHNNGYIRLQNKDGIKNCGRKTLDFKPKQYYDGRDRNGNI